MKTNEWARLLAYVTGLINQQVLLQNEYWQRRTAFCERSCPSDCGLQIHRAVRNWQVIGTTAGRGHRAPTFEQTRPVKQMLGLPLHPKFRKLLGA